MTKLFFAILILSALASDIYIYRRKLPRVRSKRLKAFFVAINALFWALFPIGMLTLSTGPLFRAFEVYAVIFGYVCGVKITVAMAMWLSRRFKRSKRLWKILCLAVCVSAGIVLFYGGTAGRTSIRVESVDICSPNVSQSLDGLRIVLFSDLHLGAILQERRIVREVVSAINGLEPDIVIQCGDIVNRQYDELDGTAEELAKIRSRYGVYFVLGNHDLGVYIKKNAGSVRPEVSVMRIIQAQREMGWTMLDGKTMQVSIGADILSISGIPYPEELFGRSHAPLNEKYDYSCLYEQVNDGTFNLTVSHAPQPVVAIFGDSRPDLMVAGHLHCMQMKIALGNWKWSPAALVSECWSGLYSRSNYLYGNNEQSLYVNDGIGYGLLPVRIGAAPEITLITLKRCEQ